MNPPIDGQWTLESLKEYLESEFHACDKRHNQEVCHIESLTKQARDDAKLAMDKAERASEKRFEAVNEFREVLRDQQGTLMPRVEATARMDSMAERINLVVARMDKLEGSGVGKHALWGYILGAMGLIIMIMSIAISILKK